MTWTSPAIATHIGEAKLVRHIHLPSVDQSFIVYTAQRYDAGDQFFFKVLFGPNYSEKAIPIFVPGIKAFHVIETSTPNNVLFVYEVDGWIWSLIHNIYTDAAIQAPIKHFLGSMPSMIDDGWLRVFYLRANDTKLRQSLDGVERVIHDPSAVITNDQDTQRKDALSVVRYASLYEVSPFLALPLPLEPGTDVLYNATFDDVLFTFALPDGTVSWYTFDDAHYSGGSVLDQVDGNHGTPNGSIISAPGMVAQSRDFTPNAYYQFGNPLNLRITGDQSIAFWLNVDNLTSRRNPMNKAYGGEGTTTLETDGSMNYFYGTNGGDGVPYAIHTSPIGSAVVGTWKHFCHIRNLTSMELQWWVNGVLRSTIAAPYSAAVAGGNNFQIGYGYTGYGVDGKLDEFLIANRAWDVNTIELLYQKGVEGRLASYPKTRYIRCLMDQSGNLKHAQLNSYTIELVNHGLMFVGISPNLYIRQWAIPAHITFETWITPKLESKLCYVIRHGNLQFKYYNDGTLEFDVGASVYRQTSGVRLKAGTKAHVAVVHTFGSGSATFMTINGKVVPASWFTGDGNDSIGSGNIDLRVCLGDGDILDSMRLKQSRKTAQQLLDYVGGKV